MGALVEIEAWAYGGDPSRLTVDRASSAYGHGAQVPWPKR